MERPTAAPFHWPYLDHPNLAKVEAENRECRVQAIRQQAASEARQAAERKRIAAIGFHADDWEGPTKWGQPEYVDRDECPKCGVRHDVGCEHLTKSNIRRQEAIRARLLKLNRQADLYVRNLTDVCREREQLLGEQIRLMKQGRAA